MRPGAAGRVWLGRAANGLAAIRPTAAVQASSSAWAAAKASNGSRKTVVAVLISSVVRLASRATTALSVPKPTCTILEVIATARASPLKAEPPESEIGNTAFAGRSQPGEPTDSAYWP